MSERYNFSWLYIAARNVDGSGSSEVSSTKTGPQRGWLEGSAGFIHKNRPPAWMVRAPAMVSGQYRLRLGTGIVPAGLLTGSRRRPEWTLRSNGGWA